MRKTALNLQDVKNKLNQLKGQDVCLAINRGRKKIDIINATIKDVYPSVFTICFQNNLQTFSYFDIMCGNVVIKND